VRELKNTIERSLHRQGDDGARLQKLVIDPFDVGGQTTNGVAPTQTAEQGEATAAIPSDLRKALEAQERAWLSLALTHSGQNQKQAAEQLGLSYDQMRGLIRKHGLRTRASRS
jgi:psp operon transcriptional activator